MSWQRFPCTDASSLPREEFAARYGASPDNLGAVAAFAEAHGLKVTGRSAGQRTVSVTGSVKDVQAAFGVKLQRYEAPAEVYRGHEGFVHVPQKLAGIVESVLGLDNRQAARTRTLRTGAAVRARNVALPGNSGPAGASALTPPQVASLYNFPTNNAAGQPLAFLGLGGGYAKSDVIAFLKPLGITTLNIVDQSVDGGANSPAGSATNVPCPIILISRSTSISTSSPLWRLAPTSSSTSRRTPPNNQSLTRSPKPCMIAQTHLQSLLTVGLALKTAGTLLRALRWPTRLTMPPPSA